MAILADPHLDELAKRLKPASASNLLLWLIFGFFVVFILWASLVKLDRTVHAAGRIVPSGWLQVISNSQGGTVAAILVRPGDLVRRGQDLVRLVPTESEAELGSNVSTVASLSAKTARLEAEVRGQDPRFPTPRDAAEKDQIAVERELHLARLKDLSIETAEAEARASEASRAIAEAEAAYQSRVTARDSAREQLALIRPLVDRGIEPRLSLIQLDNQASVASSDAAQARASLARMRASLAEAHASVAKVRQQWRSQAAADLTATRAERDMRNRNTPALEERVRRSRIVSPVNGVVNRVLVTTVGSSVAANQPIVEVVPFADRLTVEALVSPKDVASVRVGQKARINISAYDSAVYGAMEGEVVTISPDATVEERTGESHYMVRVRTYADTLRDPNGRKLPIGPGMTADVNLLGDKRSVMAYLLTPLTRLSETAFRE
jgi:membrane fusion protein, adhesin transport system